MPLPNIKNAAMPLSMSQQDLGFGDGLAQQEKDATEELKRRKLQQDRQASLMPQGASMDLGLTGGVSSLLGGA